MSKDLLSALMEKAVKFCQDNIANSYYHNPVVSSFQRAKTDEYWASVTTEGAIDTFPRTSNQGHASKINYTHGGYFRDILTFY
jgi:hypothetical protein